MWEEKSNTNKYEYILKEIIFFSYSERCLRCTLRLRMQNKIYWLIYHHETIPIFITYNIYFLTYFCLEILSSFFSFL